MSMNYDFDIYAIIPQPLCGAVKTGKFQDPAGTKDTVNCDKVALFRDPKTVAALQASCPRVIGAFRKAGFGCNILDSVAGPEHVVSKDKGDRKAFVKKLNTALNKEFTRNERTVKKILNAPLNRPTTMLDRLNNIEPSTNFVVNDFMTEAKAATTGPKAKASPAQPAAAKPWGRSWTSGFVSAVFGH